MERAALQIADERTASEAMRPRRSKNKVNRHHFTRHLSAIQNGTRRGDYEQETIPEEFKVEAVKQVLDPF